MRRFAWITVCAFALGLVPTVRAETLDDAKKQITEKLAALKSISMKNKVDQDYATEEFKFKSHAEGVTEYAREGDKKWKSRSESKVTSTRKLKEEEKEQKEDGKILFVYDGEYAYTLSESPSYKNAMKMKPKTADMPSPFDGKAMFEVLEKDHNLKLLPGEKVDGKDTFVIESKPKKEDDQAANFMARSVTYYHKDSGIALKQVAFDKAGKQVMTMIVEDLKLNPSIEADRFVFKAPPDVTVVDMTQMQQMQEEAAKQQAQEEAAEDKDAAATDTAKSDETKSDEQPKEEKKDDKVKDTLKKLKLR